MEMKLRQGRVALRQRGDILLVTLIFLLVSLLAILTASRAGIVDTLLTGNNLARQKDVQVADIALRQIESQINATSAGMPLETSASTQPWYRDVPAGSAAPSASYWDACLGNASASARCATVTLAAGSTNLPYTAYVVVQPTGRLDATACTLGSSGQYTADYYDVFVHVKESGGATAINTETVYRICTITS